MTSIPQLPSAASVSAAADAIVGPIDLLVTEVDGVIADWQSLPAVYSAPEADLVYSAWTPLDTFVDGLRSVADSARGALDSYATALEGLRTRRDVLIDRAATVDAMDRSDPAYAIVDGVEE